MIKLNVKEKRNGSDRMRCWFDRPDNSLNCAFDNTSDCHNLRDLREEGLMEGNDMSFRRALFGGSTAGGSPAELWLNKVESTVESIYHKSNASDIITEDRETCNAMAAAAFLGCAFTVTSFTDSVPSERNGRFCDSIREAATTRYGGRFSIYLGQCSHFTADCNSVGSGINRMKYGILADRFVMADMALNSIWLVEAMNGNPGAAYRFTPSVNPKTLFATELRGAFISVISAYKEYSLRN